MDVDCRNERFPGAGATVVGLDQGYRRPRKPNPAQPNRRIRWKCQRVGGEIPRSAPRRGSPQYRPTTSWNRCCRRMRAIARARSHRIWMIRELLHLLAPKQGEISAQKSARVARGNAVSRKMYSNRQCSPVTSSKYFKRSPCNPFWFFLTYLGLCIKKHGRSD